MSAKNKPEFHYATAVRHARDAWSHSRVGIGWSHIYEQLASGPFEGTAHEAWFGPIQVVYESIGTGWRWRGRPWPGSRIFFSYLSPKASSYYECRPVPGDTLISHRWNAVERIVSPHPTRLALVAIDETFLTEQFSQLLDSSGAAPLAPITSTSDPRHVRSFQRCVMEVLHELEQRPQLVEEPAARAEFGARIIDTLAEVIGGATGTARSLPAPTTRAYVVRRGTEIMESRIADAISVTELSRAIGVCPRTLRYSFQEVTGLSPTQYLLSLRLNGARRELCTARNRSPVQIVAARWGFWHMSRFARYYRLAFGERPSDTVAAGPTLSGRSRLVA
jgi:AraC family ethanolamine operon transcriptional activator